MGFSNVCGTVRTVKIPMFIGDARSTVQMLLLKRELMGLGTWGISLGSGRHGALARLQ